MKETGPHITRALKLMFRKSLDEEVLPEDWKLANVTAIFKNGDKKKTKKKINNKKTKQKTENYRPISMSYFTRWVVMSGIEKS